jgi:hypothetical protein
LCSGVVLIGHSHCCMFCFSLLVFNLCCCFALAGGVWCSC